MKNFEYASPTTEAEVLEHLRDLPGETELIAGGTDLVGLMQKMVITPKRVVNLLDVPSFRDVEELDGGVVSIGATVTLDIVLVHPYLNPYPALRHAIDGIASMQIQCQGTLGGEILQRPQCWFFRDNRGLLAAGGKLAEQGRQSLPRDFRQSRRGQIRLRLAARAGADRSGGDGPRDRPGSRPTSSSSRSKSSSASRGMKANAKTRSARGSL